MGRLQTLDPREQTIAVNDIVLLRNSLEWRVTRVRGDNIYLRSILGNKAGVEKVNSVTSIKRDFSYVPEPDHFDEYFNQEVE
jgi:hypothetical protein